MYATSQHLRSASLGLLLLSLLAALGGCGGAAGTASPDGPDPAAPESPALDLDPRSFELGGSGRIVLGRPQQQADGSVLLPIIGEELDGLRSLYCTLSYDAQRFTATQFIPAEPFSTDGDGLTMAMLKQPGIAELGMVLKRPQEQAGLSGELQLGLLRLQPVGLPTVQRSASLPAVQRHTSLPAVQRHSSAAPSSPEAAVELSYSEANQQLRWYYSNPGDFNQDGRVAVSDLTQIGLHFGESGPWSIDEAMSVVDGNGDGTISVADLTTIGLNYGRRVESYLLYGSSSPDDYPAGPGAQMHAEVPLGDAVKKTNERLSFVYEMDASGMLLWVMPADGASSGTPSNVINASGGNLAPVVSLSSDYDGSPAPVSINLAATASDLDGSIAKYEFDLDGVGNLELDNGLDNTAQITADSAGSYKTRVRVTDDMGASTTVTLYIDVVDAPLNQQPSVSLSSDLTSGAAPLEVQLTASASDADGSIVSYAFNCDGQPGNEYEGPGNTFDWTFNSDGLQVVWVTVTDDQGATAMDSVNIQVGETLGLPPAIFCDVSPASGMAPLEVSFDASDSLDLDGTVVQFQFDFTNDGVIDKLGASPTTSFVYTQNGVYTAMVIGIDDDGNFNFTTKEIHVGVQ